MMLLRNGKFLKVVFIFSASLNVVLLYVVYIFAKQIDDLNEKLSFAQLENRRLAEEIRSEKYFSSVLKREIALLKSKNVKIYELFGKKNPSEKIIVYYDAPEQQVYVTVEKLPPLLNKHYQLWNIINEKQVENLGIIQPGLIGVQKLNKTKSIHRLLVTKEDDEKESEKYPSWNVW